MTETTTFAPVTPAAEAPSLAEIISANVRVLRRRRRWTQTETGQRWGEITGRPIKAGTWCIAERPRGRAWTANDIATAARLFEVPPAALLTPLAICAHCGDRPPAGFACPACGVECPRKE
ncbi:hypothetical protein ACIQU6_38830 [Streptomyces sp. NPDC090442]|uniref:hypothetical protein n=1 Tax=Streptomyces sp. NPDC090442 TaxID=3365962 RepID=UPI0037FB8F9B